MKKDALIIDVDSTINSKNKQIKQNSIIFLSTPRQEFGNFNMLFISNKEQQYYQQIKDNISINCNLISFNNRDFLYMRKNNDKREEKIVKAELIIDLFKKYNILYAMAGEPKNAKLWHQLGLLVFLIP